MAWWSVDKCSEPLMYLERPSTSSSQKTAHIIVSCFSDVLSEKLVDSTLAIANIESGSSEFRKYYVEKLKKVFGDEQYFAFTTMVYIYIYIYLFRSQTIMMSNWKSCLE